MASRDNEAPSGIVNDNSYVPSGAQDEHIPVQSDAAPVEDPIDEATADSDEQLARDDKEAIDQSNVIKERTRHAAPKGGYQEPTDEEGLEQE